MKNNNKYTVYIALTTLILGLFLGWMIFKNPSDQNESEIEHDHADDTIWTCSMHPQIRQNEPGDCPICGMDLIPLSDDANSEDNPMEIKMSPTAMQLANVQTSVIVKQKPVKELRINGKVKLNESKISSQSSHIPGRIEKLMVNYTGETVKKGQVLGYVYSPDLVVAQEELFEAYEFKETQPTLYNAAIGKLKNWKLTDQQIEEILNSKTIQEEFPILADVSGIVLNKKVNLGDYIQKGQGIYEIGDISTVWILLDIYESDLQWVNLGDDVEFTVQSLPGETFTGQISFIDPVVDPKTRVAKARVEIANSDRLLKPDMFVLSTIKSPVNNQEDVLIVPKSAVMWTGERSVVYSKSTNENGVGFIMREVVLGPSLGDSYVVIAGIEEGEEIATNGTFSIDAAAQLAGIPSMMNPEGGVVMTGHNHGGGSTPQTSNHTNHSTSLNISSKAKAELSPLMDTYLSLKDNLAGDNLKDALASAEELKTVTSKVNMSLFTGEAHNVWMKHSGILQEELNKAILVDDIEKLRDHFIVISDQIIMLIKTFGSIDKPVYIDFCPMANDNKGAEWLSVEKEIRNPYFGSSMLNCGEIKNEVK